MLKHHFIIGRSVGELDPPKLKNTFNLSKTVWVTMSLGHTVGSQGIGTTY